MTEMLHVTGRIRTSRDEVRDEMWVVGGRISFSRPSGETRELKGHVLPGLVDAHCHVGLEIDGAVSQERAEEHAVADREAGALLLRSPGNPHDLSWMKSRDDMPVMIDGGKHIARPKRYIRNFGHEIEPDELVDYVRMEARRSDGWVKLVGDWIERGVGDLDVCWPADLLPAAVAAAHEEGAKVTAHCFGEQSLVDFAAAGVDCIEHAVGLRDDTIDAFAAQQIAIVPTLVNIANFPKFAEAGEAKFPQYAAHMRDLYERRYETIGKAREAGIPIYVGTDAGGQLGHGLVVHEIAELTRTGMTNAEAIDAGCWAARAWLGRPGIEEGAPADFVVYDADPLEDLGTMFEPATVVLRGASYRGRTPVHALPTGHDQVHPHARGEHAAHDHSHLR